MKIQWLQVLPALLLGAAITYALTNKAKPLPGAAAEDDPNLAPQTGIMFTTLETDNIPVGDLLRFRNDYRGSAAAIQNRQRQSGNVEALRGFMLDTSVLLTILAGDGSGNKPASVYLGFGKHGDTTVQGPGSSTRKFDKFHAFLVGMDAGNRPMENRVAPLSGSGVFDKASPCPPHCPQDY